MCLSACNDACGYLAVVIIVGLLLMLLTKWLNRARKARKRPVGSVPACPNLSPPKQTNAPDNELSQSQSNFMMSSAGAARAITDPTPPYSPFYGQGRGANPPLSPLVTPVVPLRHSAIVDASSPSDEHTSSDASSSHGPLQSPYSYETSSPNIASLPLLAVGGRATGFFPSSSSPGPPGLHREMAAFQKASEVGEKGCDGDTQLTQQASPLEMRGPPPKYYG